ncbi:MAG: nucleotidyltransferase domain-containing protein [Propionivibrio sp.]|uniref:Nucleotidyltransferase domain-containing protein n=1 Tax=Candidatus Propionivibrio dominans TaxID=2954373 RepID=A0A9D7F7D7_9RHOO|nr:nucleotidyltransferase domain-containing protein [Candidatus Propionivibrio dominans]MBL0167481.1 nucleotidyltransferase domain-containing protein [Propionivibrio sp.]
MKTDLQGAGITMQVAPGFNASVRLDSEEAAALSEAVRDIPGEIWLFGSRTDLSRRGGDIDILVLTDQPAFETSRAIATRFFTRCEEKIDVLVLDPAHLSPEQVDFLARISRVRIA